jgi:hypothetical protein
VWAQLRVLAARFLLESCSLVRLPLKRGRGEYRALDAPAVSCARCNRKRTRAYRSHRNHPAFPAQWFTAYIALSPVPGLFGHRHQRNDFHELDTSVGVSGPRDFAVRIKCPRQKHRQRPPHPAPRFVTIAKRPSSGTGRRISTTDLGGASSIFSVIQKIFLRPARDGFCGCSSRFTKVPLSAYLERPELFLRYRPKHMALNPIACVFKAIANIGNGLPVDAILGGLEAGRNVV